MRVLLDTCVWGGVREPLLRAGHDIIWGGDWPEDPGDEEILARACGEGRVLVTVDKDFGELAILRGRPHCGIVRLVSLSSQGQLRACVEVLARYAETLSQGAIITVERGRVRVRPGEAGPPGV